MTVCGKAGGSVVSSLVVEGNLGGLEPRGTTKSHHPAELTWEVHWGSYILQDSTSLSFYSESAVVSKAPPISWGTLANITSRK